MRHSDTNVYTLDVDATEIVSNKQSALINRLEKDNVRFAIAARMDRAVYQAIAQIRKRTGLS